MLYITSTNDIFEDFDNGSFEVLLHAMNTKHNFRNGFSRQVADYYPEAVEADEEADVKPGSLSIALVSDPSDATAKPRFVANLYCINDQRDASGSLISLGDLHSSLGELGELILPQWVIGFNKLGTGIARGNWDDINAVLRHSLRGAGILYVPAN